MRRDLLAKGGVLALGLGLFGAGSLLTEPSPPAALVLPVPGGTTVDSGSTRSTPPAAPPAARPAPEDEPLVPLAPLPPVAAAVPAAEDASAAAARAARALRSARERLRRAGGWMESLRALEALRAASGDEAVLEALTELLAGETGPVARQNLIFHAALALPWEVARPWLRRVWQEAADPGDREDALLALTFSGDLEARAAFLALAASPSAAPVHRLLDGPDEAERLGARDDEEARGVLRSYRAVEALLRRPYFHITSYLVPVRWSSHPLEGDVVAWPAIELEVLPAWLARYPGHPGSDDMALRVARGYAGQDRHLEAARWYSRAAVLPDQDVTHHAGVGLIATCELVLGLPELEALAEGAAGGQGNRTLVRYIRLRRLAAERGFAAAAAEAALLAAVDFDSPLALAWRHRLAEAPPRGLHSGLRPLAADDPLLRTLPTRAPAEPDRRAAERGVPRRFGGWWRGRELGQRGPGRLEPWPEALDLDLRALAAQLRVWETLAELERRIAVAPVGERPDLRYKWAAVCYHTPEVLFPVYGRHTENFTAALDEAAAWMGKLGASGRDGIERFQAGYSLRLAAEAFARLGAEAPDWPGLDRALFSEGLAWIKLADYRPGFRAPWDDRVRRGVAAFERCAERRPDSPLAADARAAASYWRRRHPRLF